MWNNTGKHEEGLETETRGKRGNLCMQETDVLGHNLANEVIHGALEVVPDLVICLP